MEREFYDDDERRLWEQSNQGYDPYAPVAPAEPAGPALGSFGVPINGGNPAGYQDLSYWQSRHDEGLPGAPGVNDMFDANGQMKPGWARTAKGYEMVGTAAPQGSSGTPYYGADPATIARSGGGGGGMQGPDYRMLPFSPYSPYGPFSPRNATFSFDPYKASSWEDAEKEPGYQASRTNLKKQVEQGAAYRGMLRSGMTIGDLYSNLDALGQQNFKNFDDRNFRNWSGNRDLAAQKFGLEYGVDRDVYDRGAAENERANNYKFNTEDASFKDALQRWTEMTRSLTSIAQPS